MSKYTRTLTPQTIQEDGRSRNIAYSKTEMNEVWREAYQDDFGVYQRQYGIVRHLQINKKGKFTLQTIEGDPLLVQPYKSCFTSPIGGTSMGKRQSHGGCPVYIKQQQCHDTWMMDDCYRDFIEYRNGIVEESQLAEDVMDLHREELFANAKLGLRATQWIGQLYDADKLTEQNLWADGVTHELKERFRRTTGACRGLLPMTKDMAQDTNYAYMHDTEIAEDLCTKFDIENCQFNGDLGDWINKLIKKFPPKLRKAARSGNGPRRLGVGGRSYVFLMVSDPLYPIFQQAVLEEQKMLVTNGTCWREDALTLPDGSSEMVITYRNRLVIIPDTATCIFDDYTKCQTLSMIATVSNNIQMGTSFGRHIDDIESNSDDAFGMIIQKDTNASSPTYNKWTWLMYTLLYQGVLDPSCYWGSYKVVKPKNSK